MYTIPCHKLLWSLLALIQIILTQAEEYAEIKKVKGKYLPSRSEIKEHMSKYEEHLKAKQEMFSNAKVVPVGKESKRSMAMKQQPPSQRSSQAPPVVSQSLDSGAVTTASKMMRKISSRRPPQQTMEEEDTVSYTADEYEEDDEYDETYRIRREDEKISIPVLQTNSVVTFCADDWVNKLLEIDSIEKTKLTEMDYLLSY